MFALATIRQTFDLFRQTFDLSTRYGSAHQKDEHPSLPSVRAATPQTIKCKLAPEVVDMVIDHLKGDKRSLMACSLVARDWYNRSRYHLFHSITIKNTTRLRLFLIFVSNSVAQKYVKILRLGNQHGLESKLKLGPSSLIAILASLPALTTLGVYHASWDPVERETFTLPKRATHAPYAIDTFELVEVVNGRHNGRKRSMPLSLDDVRACLRHFNAIENLTISHARWRDDGPTPPEPVPAVEPLADLKVSKLSVLSHSMLPSILQLLPKTKSASTLRSLVVGISEWESVVALGELLCQDFGAHIEELSVVFACVGRFISGQMGALWRTMGFEHCVQLRSISYWVFMFSNDPRSNRLYWQGIIAILTEGAGKLPNLERVKIAICLSGETKLLGQQLSDVDWEQLDDVFCWIPQLQAVEISIEHRVGNALAIDKVWKTVVARLPTMASRGILRRGCK